MKISRMEKPLIKGAPTAMITLLEHQTEQLDRIEALLERLVAAAERQPAA